MRTWLALEQLAFVYYFLHAQRNFATPNDDVREQERAHERVDPHVATTDM